MRYIVYVFWIIIILLGVTFASLNPQPLTINYYVDTTTIYLPILLLIALVIGAFLGIIAMLPMLVKSKSTSRRLRHQVKHIEQEVQNLRAIPIKDGH